MPLSKVVTCQLLASNPLAVYEHMSSANIPPPLSPFGSYPNQKLDLTEEDRKLFHSVVRFPASYEILDLTKPVATRQLATEEERRTRTSPDRPSAPPFAVGRYDEDRVGLYSSELFDDLENSIDGYQGRRTIHIGIDLEGPVGTPVYAFTNGTIHAVGYNPALGDYGHVMVICHDLPKNRQVYALYGHLSADSIEGRAVGQHVVTGERIASIGDFFENGGWFFPHVHFQLAIKPPETHDMPGAVALKDRPMALVDYPDPRYVLGPLY